MIDLVALVAAYVISQFFRAFLAVLAPVLIDELGVTAAELSTAAGAWFLAFAVAQFPVGVALDRIGPRRTVGWAMLAGAGGGALVFASAHGAAALTLGMALIGAGCAPVLMSAMFLFARRYEAARFATLSGVMIGFGSLGNLLGAAPFAYAVEAFGWRGVVAALAALSVAVAVVVLTVMKDPERVTAEGDSPLSGIVAILRTRAIWPILPLAVFNYAVSAGIRGLWAGPYLADAHGLDVIAIGAATTWMAAAMVAGSFVISPLDRVLRTRKWLMAGTTAVAALCVFALSRGVGAQAAVALMTAIGFSAAAYAVLMAHARSFFPAHLTGRGVTVMNFFSIGGVGLGQLVTGRISEAAAVPGEPAAAYQAIFLYYAATLAAAIAIYLFSRDARP